MRIAISCYSGSGATTAVNLISEKTGLKPINYTLRNLANDLGIDFDEIHSKAETTPYYDYLLDSKLIELTKTDDWIMASRLAIWLASDADKKIWLECPVEERARRIAQREGWTFEKALEHTKARDEKNRLRYLKLYDIDVTSHDFVDCVISTVDSPKTVVEAVLACKPRNLKAKINNISEIVNRRLTEFK